MERGFILGDTIICKESGVIGRAIKFYNPTACNEQTLVEVIDGRQYHAPTNTWVKYSKEEYEKVIGDNPGKYKDQVIVPCYDKASSGVDKTVYITTGIDYNLLKDSCTIKFPTDLYQHRLLKELLDGKKISFNTGRR